MADLPSIPIVRITVAELRKLFNEAQIVERTVTGEFTEVIIHDGEPEPDKRLPVGTRSQMVSFRDKSNNEVARAHRFLLPDKSIGASGRPTRSGCKKMAFYIEFGSLESPHNLSRHPAFTTLASDIEQFDAD